MRKDVDHSPSDESKVISIHEWKSRKERESDSLKEYMNVLSFSDLIHESQGVINEIKTSPVSADLKERSQGLIDEFHNRLASEGPNDWTRALNEMKKRLEKTLSDLGKLF